MVVVCLLVVISFALVRNLYGLPMTTDSEGRQRSFEEIGGHFEGDIVIPRMPRGVPLAGDYIRWPNGIVPYIITSDYDTRARNTIINAMRTLESLTAVNNVPCVQFRERVPSDGEYFITIRDGRGCSSMVGRYTGYRADRQVTLENPGCLNTGTIMHELIHSLGFEHEQSRPDRDDYVRVIWENIIRGMEYNFEKYSSSRVVDLNTPYDYESIMHYGRASFSRNGDDTLEPLQPGITLGQRNTLSPIDIQEIRTFYGCSASIVTASTTSITITNSATASTTSDTITEDCQTTPAIIDPNTATTSTRPRIITTRPRITTTHSKTTTTTRPSTARTTHSRGTTTKDPSGTTTKDLSATITTRIITQVTPTTKTITATSTTISASSNNVTSTTRTPISRVTSPTSIYNTIFYFILTINSLVFHRIGGRSWHYYYEIQEIIISVSGNYTFTSISTFAARSYLYVDSFNASNPWSNLIAQGNNSAGDGRFQFSVFLPNGRAMSKHKRAAPQYFLVATTEDEGVTGPLSMVASGPNVIPMNTPNTTTIKPIKNNNNNDDLAAGKLAGIIVDRAWYEPHNFVLTFHPQADYTVYGKGRDSLGVYVAKGIYSPRTLRMAFDKNYQAGLANVQQDQNQTMTIQVKWNPNTESFQGKYYLQSDGYREEQPYMIQKTNVQYDLESHIDS
ncbi:unnamed protein product [Rotaria sordida]|uniref:Metalloendopeptidase n=1 Tax=Rotaria sordida TaxID=392033 RepID=A0A814XZG6_9BILA|nr:unnamed protein product [Rotaria sordida]CAF3732501.1 unnamed protein product [Rotaria sordida]